MTSLSPQTIEWAIEHLTRYSDTDIFPKLFEFEAIGHCRDEIIKKLSKQDICQWQVHPFRQCLVPKQRYGFRVATQLDPLDMLFYLSLMLETGQRIENARLPSHLNISFSNHFVQGNDYRVFDPNMGYAAFQEHSKELSETYSYVVLADIADFYPRIYLHRLESSLDLALAASLPSHETAIIRLIKGWNQRVSYGIPVGNNPSRLLAELVIDDVDRVLLAEKVIFARYVDDYRIFCKSKLQAYRCLANLANVLYVNHGLTLQSQKTKILTSEEFVNEVLETEERKELTGLSEDFRDIIAQLGLNDPYQTIDYDGLDSDTKEQINHLNLERLLDIQLESDEIDIAMTKFLINKLGQIKNTAVLKKLLTNTEKLYPVFSEIVWYLARIIDEIPDTSRIRVGEYLLNLLDDSVVSHLEFHRTLILSLFAGSNKWGSGDKLPSLYNQNPDSNWVRRTLLLAIGKAGLNFWIKSKRLETDQLPAWEKRALIYAISCLSPDEKKHYYQTITDRLNELEHYVVTWAKTQPINL